VLGLEPADVDPRADLGARGLDSLMTIELRNDLQRAIETDVALAPFARAAVTGKVPELLAEAWARARVAKTPAAAATETDTLVL
jgi:hypothetical protein